MKFGDPRINLSRAKFHLKLSEAAFSTVFSNFDNCQPEVVGDVISSMVDEDVGMDVCANFGYSRLKPSEVSFGLF